MDFDFTQDITMILKNAAVVFSNQAKLARESAARAKNAYPTDDPDLIFKMAAQAKDFLRAAAVWEKRAASARDANLLMGPEEYADAGYMSTFKDLIRQCTKAGRVVIVTSLDREVNNPMPIPGAAVSEPSPGGPGLAGGPVGFDEKGMPKASSDYPSLAKIPGQTTGFDRHGNPIVGR